MTEEEPVVNSHIQMPKSVLKRFETKKHFYYYYDVKKDHISKNGHAVSTNTATGYYSWFSENFLNINFETPFSKLFKEIDYIDIDPPKGHINAEFDYIAKRFAYALIARNPNNIDRIKEYPNLSMFLSEQSLHDMGMIAGLAAELERDFLKDYGTTLAINKSAIPFILPTSGLYYMEFKGSELVILPVSPQKAIVFVEKKGLIIHENIVDLFLIEQIPDIQLFNNGAFLTQHKYGNGFVVSASKDELLRVYKEIVKNC